MKNAFKNLTASKSRTPKSRGAEIQRAFNNIMLAVFAMTMLAGVAQASVVTYSFVAERQSVNGVFLPGTIADEARQLDTLTGTFSYDLSTPDNVAAADKGIFSGTGSILFDGLQFNPVRQLTRTSLGSSYDDFFIVSSTESYETWVELNLEQRPPFSDLLDNRDTLPSTLVPVSHLSRAYLFLTNDKTLNTGAVFNIVSITQVAPVPLPAGGLLLLSGLAGLAIARRRKNIAA